VRQAIIHVAGSAPALVALGDQRATHVKLRVPFADLEDGVVRIALNIPDPSNPAGRGLAAPTRQAGVVLRSVDLRVVGP
jgi:hypothetical protein